MQLIATLEECRRALGDAHAGNAEALRAAEAAVREGLAPYHVKNGPWSDGALGLIREVYDDHLVNTGWMVEALGCRHSYDLRRRLGRTVHGACVHCGAAIVFVETKCRGGFTKEQTEGRLCGRCRAKLAEARKETMRHHESAAHFRERVHRELGDLEYCDAILDHAALRDAIMEHYAYWQKSDHVPGEGYRELAGEEANGCMVCGRREARPWLTTSDDVAAIHSGYYVDDAVCPGYDLWHSSRKVSQFLFHIPSYFLFGEGQLVPLFRSPLVVLCREHGDLGLEGGFVDLCGFWESQRGGSRA